ncbi:MAG: hypothetical protein CVU44_19230 [Chloroflexi bacterium HGW-Chloroflexi-6]|nr:MAG: hypothetical protein CVU44_19230 [Chloroflexi bacterium HGW-Chloroflexi-6]
MEEEIGFFDRPVVRAVIIAVLMFAAYLVLGYYFTWQDNETIRVEEARLSAEYGVEIKLSDDDINILLQQSRIRQLKAEATDMGLLVGGLILWTIFFSQFILPVRKLGDRLAILDRMMAYFSGFHGAAIFVENGNVRARQDERQKSGVGVVWLDHASAAVLRTATQFTRTIGPGVHFTRKKEYIAASVDLHTLTQVVGPNDNENPFTVSKTDENYQSMQERRWETRAMTRDGIEVVAAISVTFRIDSKPGEGNTPYGFNEENVRKAITEALVQGAKTNQPVWSQMPAKMAVDVWREYISRIRLNQLFETPPGRDQTTLQIIAGLLRRRLSEDDVESVDDFGNFTGGTMLCPETVKLKQMGIKVMGVRIKHVILPPEVEERLVNQWTTFWEKNAKKERDQIERLRRITEENAQSDALTEFAKMATAEYQHTPARTKTHALYLFAHGTSQSVIRNGSLMKKMAKSDTSILTELAHWLKDRS